MNPILYAPSETEFATNGIGILSDSLSGKAYSSLNGKMEIALQYPVKGMHYASLTNRAIILATSERNKDPQPYRIYHRTPASGGSAVFYARHIAYDLMGYVTGPFTATGAANALFTMKNNAVPACPFSFWTDKSVNAVMNVDAPKSLWDLLGGTKGSVLDTFGGEYEFDRYSVKLWTHRGADRGVAIRYGKNLSSLEQDENCANCYTGVYPYWLRSTPDQMQLVQLPERVVSAQGTFDHTRIRPLDLSQEWMEPPTEEQLRSRAEAFIKANNIGVPTVSIVVKHIPLEQTEEYKNNAILEQVSLGDTVSVEFPELAISTFDRVTETVYDFLHDRYDSVTIGSVRAGIAGTVAQQGKDLKERPTMSASQLISAQIAAAILGANGGSVRFLDTNGDGLPDELYIADNVDPAMAVKVWRFNYEGWAASKTGYNGPFILGATLENGLLADSVTAAHLIAGTIVSADESTFLLDLNVGVLKANFSELSISGKSVGDTLAKLEMLIDGIGIAITDLREETDGKAGQEDVDAITEHFKFSMDGLSISNSGTGMGITVSEERVEFTGGDDPTTVIRPDDMETTNLRVGKRLDLGNFSLIPRTNGNLSLRYTGGVDT